MSEEIEKHYEPARVESEVTRRWIEAGAYRAVPDGRAQRYVIMMPLPNVTGALHMGHAMDNTMQDLLTRWHRMKGANTLWQPGTDHAGIATQAVVEKRLLELEGKTRLDIGREALVARIWQWKDQYQQRIVKQQQAMGCSCDWDRQRFTMDAVCSRAVRECFFRLFGDGLIFRGDRLVNWDCHLETAVADDEIVTEEVQGHFWHLAYPVVDPLPGEPTRVIVATTRPETMLGDTAVAVHPDPEQALHACLDAARAKRAAASDKEKAEAEAEVARLEARIAGELPVLVRLRDMAREGRRVMLPLQEREIPLLLDEWAKPELGSGCVKITPAHDPNDYEVWRRHRDRIGIVNILASDGRLNSAAGAYQGLDRFEARKRVVADLEARGLLVRVEDRVIPIGHSDRSKTPIEPWLSKQWFVRMADVATPGGLVMGRGTAKEHRSPGLAQAAIDAVQKDWRSPSGRNLTFHPDSERYAGMYLAWLSEKRDWCISRQLWWGHRIPVWRTEVDATGLHAFVHLARGLEGPDCHARILAPDGTAHALSAFESELSSATRGPFEVQLCFRVEGGEATPQAANLISRFGLAQDPDVLDTWFSSALWPLSTLGWPDPGSASVGAGQSPLGAAPDRPDSLSYYYPGSCLVTGRDIVTLWVARMVVMGLYLEGDVPFHHSFIHANILDGKGEKMSKSKGNGIDPVDVIDRYGADALRYVLCDMQTGTQDIRLPVQAVSPYTGNLVDLATAKHGRTIFSYLCPDSGKEFDVLGTLDGVPRATLVSDRFDVGKAVCTKLWNAARFAFMALGDRHEAPLPALSELAAEDRFVLSRLVRTIETVETGLLAYNPSAAVGAVRDFFWGDVCDWYLELVKPRLKDESRAPLARSVLATVLDQVLRLFHPFMPFLTEELWRLLGEKAPRRGIGSPLETGSLLILAPWPSAKSEWRSDQVEGDFVRLKEVVRAIRDLRSRYQVPPKERLVAVAKARGEAARLLSGLEEHLKSQAGLASLVVAESPEKPARAAVAVTGDVEIWLADVLDPEKERSRLEKQREKLEKQLAASEKKLSNPGFVDRAPAELVAAEKARVDEARHQLRAVEAGLAELS